MTQLHLVVLGGGIAGLATAREALKKGARVTLIERGERVGGLARTITQNGFRFDIGGHRFHSNNPQVVQWVKDLLKLDLLSVPRVSHIHLEGRFVDYPLRFPQSLSVFSPPRAIQMGASYLAAKAKRNGQPDVSFEDWVVRRFGRAMYKVFFEPYTQKVWGIPCAQLSADWAAQRIGIPSMWQALKETLKPSPNLETSITQFYYPRRGFGMIPAALEREIIALGGVIHTQTALKDLTPQKDGFEVGLRTANGRIFRLQADKVVSTIPLNFLLEAIPPQFTSEPVRQQYRLEYRDIICLFIALNKPQISPDSWTYFPHKDLIFGRTHEPKNWSSEMVPSADVTSLAVEIFSSRGEAVWNMSDEAILERAVAQMNDIGWISRADILQWRALRVPFAYPVYRIGYHKKLAAVKEYLAQWPKLYLVGRTGSFHYMNSDGVIEDVFRFVAQAFKADEARNASPVETGRWI